MIWEKGFVANIKKTHHSLLITWCAIALTLIDWSFSPLFEAPPFRGADTLRLHL